MGFYCGTLYKLAIHFRAGTFEAYGTKEINKAQRDVLKALNNNENARVHTCGI